MTRSARVALGFLTRIPAGDADVTAEEIGKSARWFPLVGAVLGGIYAGATVILSPHMPAMVAAVVIVALDAVLTGAMHFDGLADTADGFIGSHSREDVLRIMRDPAIGTYGACSLIVAFAVKIASLATLMGTERAIVALVLAPVLGRWSAVFSSVLIPYARKPARGGEKAVGAPAYFIGRAELIIGSATVVPFALLGRWHGAVASTLCVATVAVWAWECRRRIGGVTGDTLGAGIEIIECLTLLTFTVH